MNSDLISRSALEKEIFGPGSYDAYEDLWNAVHKAIDNAPPVEVRPKGTWEHDDEYSITIDIFKCSHCGGWGHTHFRFCPNCGAEMKGGKD